MGRVKRQSLIAFTLVACSWALALGSFAYYRMAYYQIAQENTLLRLGIGETAVPEIPETPSGVLSLPKPATVGQLSLEETLQDRRSKREFLDNPLKVVQLGQLLWAAQGVTQATWGLRTAPSAGGTYPLELIVVIGDKGIDRVEAGVFRYDPSTHSLTRLQKGDRRSDLATASLSQSWVKKAPVVFVILARFERTTQRYGERGVRYVHLEAGHATQNLLLQAVAMGLGAVPVGAFGDNEVKEALGIRDQMTPLYVVPVGYPAA